MPHRIHFLSATITSLIEGMILAALTLANGAQYVASLFTDTDWDKFTGPHGFLYGTLIAIGVLWNSGRVREKNETKRREKEEEAREKRHAELVNTNKENAESLKALTVESILAQGKATNAIEAMDRSIRLLTDELSERPCQIKKAS